jgi:hypothetical protein
MDACKKCVRALCGKSPVLDAKESMLELQVRAAGRCMPRQGRYPGCVQTSALMHEVPNASTQDISWKDGPDAKLTGVQTGSPTATPRLSYMHARRMQNRDKGCNTVRRCAEVLARRPLKPTQSANTERQPLAASARAHLRRQNREGTAMAGQV